MFLNESRVGTHKGVNMKEQKVAKTEVKFDTKSAFAKMGAAVDVLMKAAPNAFEHKAGCSEKQGQPRRRKAVA